MSDCIFCKIIQGDLPSYTIYENDYVKVFLDIQPSTNGDMLLIPKKHLKTIDDIDEDLMLEMLTAIKKIRSLVKEKLDCDGLTIVQNNDYGQEIKHFHIHLTPRYLKDGLTQTYNKELLVQPEDVYEQMMDK